MTYPPPILYTKYVNTCMCIYLKGKSRFLMRFLKERERTPHLKVINLSLRGDQ